MRKAAYPYVAAAMLAVLSCGTGKKVSGLKKDVVTPAIALVEENEVPVLEVDRARDESITVEDPYGKQVILMRAVKDENGEMTATDVLDAAVVTARFRNVAERHGMVNLSFQITVPERLQDKTWQVRFYPELFTGRDSTALDPVIITGDLYRAAQLRGYDRYNRFLAGIAADSLRFLNAGQLRIFLERKTSLTEETAIAHYTDSVLVRRNRAKLSRREQMFRRWVKSPIVTEGLRLDSVITDINGDIVYHYVQTILAEKDLRKAEIALEGEIYREDKMIYDIPRSEPLTFYISTLTSLCDADRMCFNADSTQIDTVYRRGVRALMEKDYKTAVALLKPYRDYNSAVALCALDYNATALDVLRSCAEDPKVDYLRAILHARRGEDREAVECYMRACAAERSFVHRGNLDPEIAGLIKLYHLEL